jgi:hypothetical protein
MPHASCLMPHPLCHTPDSQVPRFQKKVPRFPGFQVPRFPGSQIPRFLSSQVPRRRDPLLPPTPSRQYQHTHIPTYLHTYIPIYQHTHIPLEYLLSYCIQHTAHSRPRPLSSLPPTPLLYLLSLLFPRCPDLQGMHYAYMHICIYAYGIEIRSLRSSLEAKTVDS